MKNFRFLLVVAIVVWVPASAWANGLLYKLPADGSSALYEIKMAVTKPKITGTGTLTLSSVGKAKSGGKDCRWIELSFVISMMGQKQIITAKLLIPEEDLGKGKNPFKNPQKGWVQMPPAKPLKITDFAEKHLALFRVVLAGPLRNAAKLEAKEIVTKVGKLKCAGETGRQSFQQGKSAADIDYETRLHAKSPFGVAYSKMKVIVMDDKDGEGNVSEEVELTFQLKNVSMKAKSKLPKQN
jgi:hypothetical protein